MDGERMETRCAVGHGVLPDNSDLETVPFDLTNGPCGVN
jgi:hypothetical protein